MGNVAGGTELSLPECDKWFRLDEDTGTERILVLASEDRIEDFENRVGELRKSGVEELEKFFSDTSIQAFSFVHK